MSSEFDVWKRKFYTAIGAAFDLATVNLSEGGILEVTASVWEGDLDTRFMWGEKTALSADPEAVAGRLLALLTAFLEKHPRAHSSTG